MAIGAALATNGDNHGYYRHLHRSDNGYVGPIKTLTLYIKAKFAWNDKKSDKGLSVFAGTWEFGAAWKKTARGTDREYLSVKLDDPSFPAPIYASLVKVSKATMASR